MKSLLNSLIKKEREFRNRIEQNIINKTDIDNNSSMFIYRNYYIFRCKFSKILIVFFGVSLSNAITVIMSLVLKKGDIFIDVGANIGDVTDKASWFVGINGQVHSFEPSPNTMKLLQNRIKCFKLTNVQANQFALGSATGSATLHEFKENYGGSSSLAYGKETAPGQELYSKTVVSIQTLNNYISIKNIRNIKMIKIDVQGFEIDVLDGATEILLSKEPPVLFVEVENGALDAFGLKNSDLLNKILSFGYQMYSWRNGFLISVKSDIDLPIEGHDDVICLNLNSKNHRFILEKLNQLAKNIH